MLTLGIAQNAKIRATVVFIIVPNQFIFPLTRFTNIRVI